FAKSSRGKGVDGFAASVREAAGLNPFPATQVDSTPRAAPGDTFGQVDVQLMSLLRRLAQAAPPDVASRPATGGLNAAISHLHTGSGGLANTNLIVAHRDELRQAATGALDHMVIDVVGGMFDQILSDPKVPPQMARQIGRLQLPVLRAAL